MNFFISPSYLMTDETTNGIELSDDTSLQQFEDDLEFYDESG